MTEFTTRNGRKVFDGGGINPDIITDRKGGDGAFREFIDYILLAQGITPTY